MDALRRPCFMQVGIVKHITSHETHPLIAEVRSKAERYHTDFLWCRTVSLSFANRNPFLHLLCLFHFIGTCTVLTVWGVVWCPFASFMEVWCCCYRYCYIQPTEGPRDSCSLSPHCTSQRQGLGGIYGDSSRLLAL